MKKVFIVLITILLVVLVAALAYVYFYRPDVVIEARNTYNNSTYLKKTEDTQQEDVVLEKEVDEEEIVNSPEELTPLETKVLKNDYHIYQTFNNCGPASFSMALSYFGINMSQKELADDLRPYQHPRGDNDDKSTTLKELERKGEELGFTAYTRPNGSPELIELFITHDIPVITKTWLKEDEDIGHFRVVKGYDSKNKTLIQDDSLQGKNLVYSYEDFNKIWEKFNYEYLVLVPKEKEDLAKRIIGPDIDEEYSWKNYTQILENKLKDNPEDHMLRFNFAVALYNVGNYQRSVEEYEKIKDVIPKRAVWYHIEPVKAYFELGEYEKVMEISKEILEGGNRAFSELYILRGKVYEKQNNLSMAKEEYENAVKYNVNLPEAKEALERITTL